MSHEFQEKFVAFIDILGFKAMVEAAERGERRTVAEVREILDQLAGAGKAASIRTHGPTTCPCSPRVRQDLAFEVTQISDAVFGTDPAGSFPHAIPLKSKAAWFVLNEVNVRPSLFRSMIKGVLFLREARRKGCSTDYRA
ncbi:MAG TPA: hypothetical protein VGC56_12045 [Allosphingosinicella sp.]|jgi:hypothetical protein